ncbi:regulator of microtubule dynamics protein 3 [Brienomyrus brachyistius]|uniref:regulator of microtubule dynamics protein 3 n=1 Tax=Brienomyrus brachyistius TaxID=42636 RepID=UPI0020B41EF4|nr:regulator of microtubule dynamics protein 3 [Brienomyrus brachyistius]
MDKLGRGTWISVGVGAAAGTVLVIFMIFKERKRRREERDKMPQRERLAVRVPGGVAIVSAGAREGSVCDSAAGGAALVLPNQQGELRHWLDEVLHCVADLQGEVAELRGSLQGVAVQIVQDVKASLEESQKAARRRRHLLPRERTDSVSSSSIYFTASGVSMYDGESEGGYTTANPESDYNADTDRETDKEMEKESEDEEEQSCATVRTLRKDSCAEEEEMELTLPLDPEMPGGELVQLLSQSDALHAGSAQEKAEGYQLLRASQPQFGENAEFLWRLARAYSDMYETTDDAEEKKAYMEQGRDEAEAALQRNGLSAEGHKWFAVLASTTSHHETMHSKLKSSLILKEHVDRAMALNSEDAQCFYLLGKWCYEISTLGWLERKAAAALYETPPTATMQDALQNFLKAEELCPSFSKTLRLYIAKCHKDLGNISEAEKWFQLASQMNGVSGVDKDGASLEEAVAELQN